MSDRERLNRAVDLNEGYKSLPYLDTKNLWTFAKGRCLETNPLKPDEYKWLLDNSHLVMAITERGAEWLKQRGLDAAERDCDRVFQFWDRLNDARQNALIEMVYQMGLKSVLGFTKMLRAIATEDWQKAYEEGLDSDWHREDTPTRARKVMLQLKTGMFLE